MALPARFRGVLGISALEPISPPLDLRLAGFPGLCPVLAVWTVFNF